MVAVLAASPVTSLNEGVSRLQREARPVYTKTTGAETITVAQMIDGIIFQNGAQAAHNLTTPTAALLVAALKDAKVGDTFLFTVCNHAGGAAITVVGGSGVTVRGTAAGAAGAGATFACRVDNATAASEAVSMYLAG